MLALKVIGRALHVHSARTPELYEAAQLRFIANNKRMAPYLEWPDVFEDVTPMPAVVSGGFWQVLCPCGNAPALDPEWNVARCFECGAVYRNVILPFEWQAIERILLLRPRMSQRNWTSESLDELRQENIDHGDPVPNEVLD